MSEIERRDADQLLAALWAQDEPPARDPAFVIAAMDRIERRRLLQGVLALVPAALASAVVLWALAPVIADVVSAVRLDTSAIGPLAAAVVMALFLWSWASDRLPPIST